MNHRFLRLLSALLALAMLLCVAGCGEKDTGWIAKNDVAAYTPGLYRILQLHGISNIISAYGVNYAAALEQDVSGATGSEYVSIYADGELSWLAATDTLFAQHELTLDDEDSNWQPEYYAKQEYDAQPEYYDALGITLDDLNAYYRAGYKTNLLFEALYCTAGGEFAVERETLLKMMEDAYYRINYIYLSKTDIDTGEPYDSVTIDDLAATAQGYLDRYNAGEDFIDLYFENRLAHDSTAERQEDYNYDVYLPVEDSGAMPAEFTPAAAALADNEAVLIEGDDYVAVLRRRPVNDVDESDRNWQSTSLSLLYDAYSDEFNEWLSQKVDEDATLVFNEDAKALYTPESLVQDAKKYYLTHSN